MGRQRAKKRSNVDVKNQSSDGKRRRAIIALSILGMGTMTAVSLLQLGVVKHLPDPSIESFDSDKVNLSEEAFPLGIPDGLLSLAGFAANIPLAMWGGNDRARRLPLMPLAHAGKAIIEAAVRMVFLSNADEGEGVVRLLHRRRARELGRRGVDATGSDTRRCFALVGRDIRPEASNAESDIRHNE